MHTPPNNRSIQKTVTCQEIRRAVAQLCQLAVFRDLIQYLRRHLSLAGDFKSATHLRIVWREVQGHMVISFGICKDHSGKYKLALDSATIA